MARNYKNIEIYHLAYCFVLEVYGKTNDFPKSESQNITSQIRRAAVSIPLNIVEGSAKAGDREFIYFLNVAYASAKEVEVLISLCHDLNYFNDADFKYLAGKLDEVNAKLFLFLRNMGSRVPEKKYQFFRKFEDNSNSSNSS
jgi:four helix bundle protein